MDFSNQGLVDDDEFIPELGPDVFIIYSQSVFFEVPDFKEGDLTGYSYYVKYNGGVTVIKYYYSDGFEIAKTYFIDQKAVSKLDSLFSKEKFINYPAILPRTNKIIGPTPKFEFGYRVHPNSKIKSVYGLTTMAEKRYYPHGFFKLYRTLKKVISIP